MAREAGIERIGFVTLTVGDWDGESFTQCFDSAEANRRINALARRFLPALFPRWVIVTERHKNGAIHFHLAVEMRFACRQGYDWEAVRGGDYRSACVELRALWACLRSELPAFGFGRSQVEPAKGGESLANYVAKYVEKNLFNRLAEDKGKKMVRYGGWNRTHCRPVDISWASPRAAAWRANAAALGALIGVRDREEMKPAFGAKWAFKISRVMNAVAGGDSALHVVTESLGEMPVMLIARQLVAREASARWMDKRECENSSKRVEWRLAA